MKKAKTRQWYVVVMLPQQEVIGFANTRPKAIELRKEIHFNVAYKMSVRRVTEKPYLGQSLKKSETL